MTQEERLAMLEEVLEVDEGSLSPDMLLDDVDNYDSMAKLSMIVMFEDEFDKKLEGRQIAAFKTVDDILKLMV